MINCFKLELNRKMKMDETVAKAKEAAALGYNMINITGDEPIERFNIIREIQQIKSLEGIEQVMLTTNGQLLKFTAGDLKGAGLDKVAVTVDTFRYARFKKNLEDDTLENVVEGINKATDEGLRPVRIVMKVEKDFNDDEIMDFVQLTFQHDYEILFIGSDSFPADEIRSRLPGFRETAAQDQDVITGKYPGAIGKICFEKQGTECTEYIL